MGFFFDLFKGKQPEPEYQEHSTGYWMVKMKAAFDEGYNLGLNEGGAG